jgi:hypothetical protein
VGQRSRKANGKAKRTPLTPQEGKTSILVLKFTGKPDGCMLQRLRRYFAFDPARREWTATDSPAPREIWEDTQEQYGPELTATIRPSPTTPREE